MILVLHLDSPRLFLTITSSNSVITPLFEKMLSASDAGRIGRLVLPKKCAEVSLPRAPYLSVPCCFVAVTFSRIDPEGKLIMGFRKASCGSSEQVYGLSARSSQGTRRKGGNLGSKSKRLRIENEDSMELKLTWEEAQQLLRPPPNCVPSVVLVEGHEFEEYEEAPVLGKRTYFTTNQSGASPSCVHCVRENYQWAQCEDCSKWRRLPVDALLPSRWTCSNNTWDPER
ncbi:hypothetical protein BHE74_00010401 [Ensete ventricosum]|nr:hypothetical protein BHE74_00010401 [Ensete ventricosum]RZR99544.1 hypothetical protein BHM03_00029110 [Ensete ventricosum]